MTDHEFVALSLWVIHTYCFLTGDYTPYINITSATASAGKTRVLEVLELLVRNPELADSITTAALIRTVDNPPFLWTKWMRILAAIRIGRKRCGASSTGAFHEREK